MTKLIIAFGPPADFGLDEALLATKGTAICAKSWLRGTGLQVGQLCHYVEDGAEGAVMHSRFHLEDLLAVEIFGAANVHPEPIVDQHFKQTGS